MRRTALTLVAAVLLLGSGFAANSGGTPGPGESLLGPRLRRPSPAFSGGEVLFPGGDRTRGMAGYLRDPRDASGRVEVFVLGSPEGRILERIGARVHTRAGEVLSVRVPADRVSRLAEVPGIREVRLSNPVAPLLDVSVPAVRADALRNLVQGDFTGMTGEGVVVGIVDSGLDWTHDDFRNPDGTTRVLWYWDQADPSGPPPGSGSGDTLYSFGTEWSGADLDAGSGPVGDAVGHGTHVAGVAVGNGRGAIADSLRHRYVGLAPKADIVIVSADLFLETGVLDAVNYVFEKATELGRPAVVNLSLGGHFGPHDGTSPLELGLDALAGPGRLVVTAAGNEAEDRIHAEIAVPPGGSDTASVFIPQYTPSTVFNIFVVDCFYERPDSMTVTVITPSGAAFGPYGALEAIEEVTGEGTIYLVHLDNDPAGLRRQVQFDVSDFNPNPMNPNLLDPPASGEWKIVFSDLAGSPGGGEVDLWIPAATMVDFAGNGPPFLLGYDPGEEVASPGNAHRVVTVGAFNTKRCWPDSTGATRCTSIPETLSVSGRISFFSSRGPTRDGRQKPDLVAPGFVISSSLSAQMSPENRAANELGKTKDPDLRHFVFAGTSMAAPHVTGALALLLQNNPQVTPEDSKQRLIDSAIQDAWTGFEWSEEAGFGKLDVQGLVDTVTAVDLRVLEIHEDSGGLPRLVWGDPSARAAAYDLERMAPGGSWIEAARFSGPGPHSWTDSEPVSEVRYRVWATLRDGNRVLWGEAVWNGGLTPRLDLSVFPNPSRSETVLYLRVPARSQAAALTAEVFDLSGRRVRRLESLLPANAQSGRLVWDGNDDRNRPVRSGLYWVRVRTGSLSRTTRVVRIR